MKAPFLLVLFLTTLQILAAPDWENQAVFRRNKLPAHAVKSKRLKIGHLIRARYLAEAAVF